MKRLFLIMIIALAFTKITEAKTLKGGVNIGFFYSSLTPYGDWIEIDRDVVAWRPASVAFNWRPYSDGRWIWTDDGWYWDSYEPFGWAAYHYGRWYYDDYNGWLWIPGNEWAPAWVEWRYDDDYIGWAPLPPYAEFRVGIGIHFSIGWRSHYKNWNYVSYGHFCNPGVHKFFINDRNKYRVHAHTKYRTNYGYDNGRIINRGVDKEIIEKRGGYKLRSNEIARSSDRNVYERRNDNKIYRPERNEIKRNTDKTEIRLQRTEQKSNLRTQAIPESHRTSNESVRREYTDNNVNTLPQRNIERRIEDKSISERNNVEVDRRNKNLDETRRFPKNEFEQQKSAEQKREVSPRRDSSPQREINPQRQNTPQRDVSPQRETRKAEPNANTRGNRNQSENRQSGERRSRR